MPRPQFCSLRGCQELLAEFEAAGDTVKADLIRRQIDRLAEEATARTARRRRAALGRAAARFLGQH